MPVIIQMTTVAVPSKAFLDEIGNCSFSKEQPTKSNLVLSAKNKFPWRQSKISLKHTYLHHKRRRQVLTPGGIQRTFLRLQTKHLPAAESERNNPRSVMNSNMQRRRCSRQCRRKAELKLRF